MVSPLSQGTGNVPCMFKKRTIPKIPQKIIFWEKGVGGFSASDHPAAGAIGFLPLSQRLFTSADGSHLRKVKQKPHVILAVASTLRRLCTLFYHKENEPFSLYSQERTKKIPLISSAMLGCFGPSARIGSLNATKQMFTEKTTAMAVEGYLEVILF